MVHPTILVSLHQMTIPDRCRGGASHQCQSTYFHPMTIAFCDDSSPRVLAALRQPFRIADRRLFSLWFWHCPALRAPGRKLMLCLRSSAENKISWSPKIMSLSVSLFYHLPLCICCAGLTGSLQPVNHGRLSLFYRPSTFDRSISAGL